MHVIIGIDPHKASHTAVAIGDNEGELCRTKVRATRRQVDDLVRWAEPFGSRTWAIDSADGLGYLLSQQLVAAGEAVVDVPATLAARSRVLATGRSTKTDPNDALSVAITALRNPTLRRVEPVGPSGCQAGSMSILNKTIEPSATSRSARLGVDLSSTSPQSVLSGCGVRTGAERVGRRSKRR